MPRPTGHSTCCCTQRRCVGRRRMFISTHAVRSVQEEDVATLRTTARTLELVPLAGGGADRIRAAAAAAALQVVRVVDARVDLGTLDIDTPERRIAAIVLVGLVAQVDLAECGDVVAAGQ